MLSTFKRILVTVKYLKLSQVLYFCYYKLKKRPTYFELKTNISSQINTFRNPVIFIQKRKSLSVHNNKITVKFLNKQIEFPEDLIDWNYKSYGKLWTYNLNYFEFIDSLSVQEAHFLLNSYFNSKYQLVDGLEPYPTSLRIVNWIKFDIKTNSLTKELRMFIRTDAERLNKYLEYHIRANHLLENACALVVASYYFKDFPYREKAELLLIRELKEQFGKTGQHFEGSFMYHLVLIDRLLDVFSIISDGLCDKTSSKLQNLLIGTISKAIFVSNYYFCDNSFPMINDSNIEETPDFSKILQKAKLLGIELNSISQKGLYEKISNQYFTAIIDFAEIEPTYQPGHSHADSLSFVLFIDSKPIVVDRGVTTYELCEKRNIERSTLAHNTVEYAESNSSDIWAGFRVGRRANITNIKIGKNSLEASHNGYIRFGALHTRKFILIEKKLVVQDVFTEEKELGKISSIHFHPDITFDIQQNYLVLNGNIRFSWENVIEWELNDYEFAIGFNLTKKAKVWRAKIHEKSLIKFEK